jgi:starch-binding outer membrane protein, SusD/RagB family
VTRLSKRTRRAAGVLLAAAPALLVAGCGVEDELLEPQQPGVISPEDVAAAGATGAQALYIGALGSLKNWTGGGGGSNQENIWMYADLLTDVWKVSDTFIQRIDTDARRLQTNNSTVSSAYSTTTQSRAFYRDAIRALKSSLPNEPEKQGEMYFALGYTEMFMGEIFCNGIPLGETVDGEPQYTAPLTNQQVFAAALAHLDSAIALASGSNALAVSVRNAATVAKGRTLVNMGRFAEAATAVANVQTNYQYTLTFSQPTQSNAIWTLNATPTTARYAVGDSAELVAGAEVVVRNAIPFASAGDPRVPVSGNFKNSSRKSIDGLTNYVGQLIWTDRAHPIVLASWIDARLIQAEARLQANDIPG